MAVDLTSQLESETCTPSLLQGLRPLEVAGIVSKLLTDDGIPSVIWGTMEMSYYNVPTVIPCTYVRSHPTALNFIFINNSGNSCCRSRRTIRLGDVRHIEYWRSTMLLSRQKIQVTLVILSLFPHHPAHWLIKNDFGIDLWRRSSTLWRIDFSPTSPDLVNQELSVINGTTVWRCSIRYPKLHKLIETSALLAMRDCNSDYASFRKYPILYLRQYTDPELRGCDELRNSEEEQLVKAVYKDIDGMSDNLKRGHEILCG